MMIYFYNDRAREVNVNFLKLCYNIMENKAVKEVVLSHIFVLLVVTHSLFELESEGDGWHSSGKQCFLQTIELAPM